MGTPPRRIVVDGLGRLPVFSHASTAGGLVFVSGTLGTVGDGFALAEGGAGPETAQTLLNVERILEAAGASLRDVVKVSVYLADMDDFRAMNEAYAAFFGDEPPARITVGGAQLALGARVEIECVARAPRGRVSGIGRRTGFLERGGERLYYEDHGEGDTLVLCHGMGGNHAVWYQQVAHFARTRRVVTWDHRGFGRSTDGAGLSGPEVAAGDLAALLDRLGVERADVVGQSMGGWTALGLTRRAPGRVRRLVLADTLGGLSTSRVRELLGRIRAAVGGRAPVAAESDRLGLHPALDPAFTERDPARAHLYQMLGAFGEPELAKVVPRLMATRVDRGDVTGLDVPVLFVVGERDPLFPPAVVRAAAALLPDARVVEIPGCGHSPYFEDPAAWNDAVGGFLDEGS